jgi:methylphosphotriester-DNA--protein-cysteine methyltransferase
VIILSGVLVVVAIALLIAGIVAGNSGTEVVGLDGLNLIYVSIGVSIVSALFLAIGVFVRRKDLFGSPGAAATGPAARTAKHGKAGKGGPAEPAVKTATTQAGAGATTTATSGGTGGTSVYPTGSHSSGADPDTAELAAMMPPAGDVPATAVVYVVPGRRRYHIDSCRQLAGRSKEELTFEEAREEGFSPCTACMPDTALAARAAVGGLVTAEESTTESAAGREFEAADSAAIAYEDERGSVGRAEWSEANGSPSSVTPVQRQALEDLTDDEPTPPAAEPSGGLPGEDARQAEPAAGDRSAAADTAAADETAVTPAPDAATPAATAEQDQLAEQAEQAAQGEPDDHGDAPPAAAEVPPQATRPTPAAAAGDGSLVRILSGTKRYHRPDCALIEDIGDDADDLESLSRAEAKARGCTPCLVCQPDKEPATRD